MSRSWPAPSRGTLVLCLLATGCTSSAPSAAPASSASYDCTSLLDDARLEGLRLVEAQSYGSSHALCHLAPADQPTSGATEARPVRGTRVVVRRADGALEVREHVFTRGAGDPGDAGPVVRPRS